MVVKSVATLLKIRTQDLVDKEIAEEVVAVVVAHTIDLVVAVVVDSVEAVEVAVALEVDVVVAVDVVDSVEKEEKETTKSIYLQPTNFPYLSTIYLSFFNFRE
jgi:hypothetical protein